MRLLPKKGIFDQNRILYLPVGSIAPNPNQPRQVFAPEDLRALADSIQALGILQPLTVRRQPQGWELVAGERRLRAAQLLGLEQVPCLSVQADASASSLLALEEILAHQLTVAQTEQLTERLLAPPPPTKPKRTVILKDVRLFLNTLSRSVDLMRSAGVDAQCQREDSEEEILLTIRIPRQGKARQPAP